MNELPTVIKEFGLQVGLIIVLLCFCWLIINKFLKSLKTTTDEATNERKELTSKYNIMIENHISHNTEAQREMIQALRDLRTDIHDSARNSCDEHKRIMDKL